MTACIPRPDEFDKNFDDKAWKKALGLFQSKTGVSEKIRGVYAAYSKIDRDKIDPQLCIKDCFSPADFEKARKDAIEYLDKSIAPLSNSVDELRSHLEETVKDFQKSKLCPKSTLKFAEELLKRVKEYKDTVKSAFSEFEVEFKKVQQQRLKVFGIASEKLVKYMSIWDDGVKQLKEDLKNANGDSAKLSLYDSFRTHYVRGFGTSLPFFSKDSNLQKHVKNWQGLASDGGQPKEASKIDALLKLLDEKYVPDLKEDMIKSGIIE